MRYEKTLLALVGGCFVYVAVACGGGNGHTTLTSPVPEAEAAGTDGARIKARTLEGEDGSKAIDSLWDTKLQTTCAWVIADDDEHHCLPSGIVAEEAYATYSDAKCTKPVVMLKTCYDKELTPTYALLRKTSASCGRPPAYKVHTVGAEVSKVYSNANSDCSALSVAERYFALGEEVAPSEFVRATLTTP
jgi:hypothetical protein